MRGVAKLEKLDGNTIETLERTFWDVQHLSAAMAAAPITCTRGEVATLVRRIVSVSPGRWASSLVRSHAMVQTQISGRASSVDGETHIAQAHQERE